MALTDQAIESIKAMIVSGELKPGDRLPKEADLAVRLGLSRNSMREAIKALLLSGGGTVLGGGARCGGRGVAAPRAGQPDVRIVYDMRLIPDGGAARLACLTA